jgi:hypothetical protein
VAGHTAEVISRLTKQPAVIGHSTGGLLGQIIADRVLSAVTVAIVLRRAAAADLRAEVVHAGAPESAALAPCDHLTLDQSKYRWVNALGDDAGQQLYETYHVAGPGVALIQRATANLNPWTEAKLNPANPNRGPLLIMDGEKNHGPMGGCERLVQEAAAEPSRHRDQEDAESRPLAHDRQRLAGGRRDGTRICEALRVTAELGSGLGSHVGRTTSKDEGLRERQRRPAAVPGPDVRSGFRVADLMGRGAGEPGQIEIRGSRRVGARNRGLDRDANGRDRLAGHAGTKTRRYQDALRLGRT